MHSKNINLLCSLSAIFFLFSCSNKSIPYSAKVNYLSSTDGTITVRAIGLGQNQQAAIEDAEKNALEVVLFRGLPESEQKIALLSTNEKEEKQKNQVYFDQFYKGRLYKTFLMSSIPTANAINMKGGSKSIAVDVKLNVTALRKDLEKKNIIKKFGY